MSGNRLSHALDAALTLPSDGRILVLNPSADTDLSALPRERLDLVQSHYPDYAALLAQGYAVTPKPDRDAYAAAVVFMPRARDWAQALVALAVSLVPDGPVVVDGQKTDGIESMLKAVRTRARVENTVSKAHGKLFWFNGGEFAAWRERTRELAEGLITRPGLFSADAPDPASVALAQALPGALAGRGADFGAGWGYLARAVLEHPEVRELDLVEADSRALDCARPNVPDQRARFLWADVTEYTADRPYDFIVMNPPFHTGRAADPGLGRAFIAAAARNLVPSGALYLVANRHLPYEAELAARFTDHAEIAQATGFKIIRAVKPRRQIRK